MRDIIYSILVRYYGRMYDYAFCESLTEYIANRINDGTFLTRGDVMDYIWMNTTGGGVAEASSREIQAALPLLEDTDRRSYKGAIE